MKIANLVAATPLIALSMHAATVTFTHDVAPILYQHCVACHHPNDIAPMSLLTYKDARPWAASIREAIISGKMPPWKADPHFGKWSNDPRLSDAEITTIKAWIEGGKVEGDPQDMPPAPAFADGWKIGKPDAIVAIPQQVIEPTGPDEYVYINVPTNFPEDRWIIAAELRPGNRRIVHHAHVFVAEKAEPTAAAKPQDKDPQLEYSQWLRIKQGSLEWVRPEAPVIDNGCSVDDNGLFPGRKLPIWAASSVLICPAARPMSIPKARLAKFPPAPPSIFKFTIRAPRAKRKWMPPAWA